MCLNSRLLIIYFLSASILFGVSDSIASPPINKDQSSREIGAPPKLDLIKVFDWGLRRSGTRTFGIYGRLITNAQSTHGEAVANKAAWAYRGQVSQRVSWVAPRQLSLKELASAESSALMDELESINSLYQDVNAPSSLEELAHLYLSVEERIRLNAEPLSGEKGYRIYERRVYRASPPYQLISYQYEREEDLLKRRVIQWLNGHWRGSFNEAKELIDFEAAAPRETLHARLWDSDHFHVGGGYQSAIAHHNVTPTADRKEMTSIVDLDFEVIDRRFERIGGTWSERVEWSIPRLFGSSKAQVSLDQHRMIRAFTLDGSIFGLERSPAQLQSRAPLPYNQRPLSLSRLQAAKGKISQEMFKQITASAKSKLFSCLDLQRESSLSTQTRHVVLRLSLNPLGRLIAAGATHQLPWLNTKCLLKTVKSMKFPPPTLASDRHNESLEGRGAMLAWPITFTKENQSRQAN